MTDVFELDDLAELDLREALDTLAESQGAELWQIGTGWTLREPGRVRHFALVEDAATALQKATKATKAAYTPRKRDKATVIYLPATKASQEPLKPVPFFLNHIIRQSARGYRIDGAGLVRHFAQLSHAVSFATKRY